MEDAVHSAEHRWDRKQFVNQIFNDFRKFQNERDGALIKAEAEKAREDYYNALPESGIF